MRVPVQWLAEYVDLPDGATGEQIAADLVRVGLEEEGLHGGEVSGPLVVGRVLEVTREEQRNGRTIAWCQVDVASANGTGEPQGIVCGAHNFGVGDLVAVVLPGGVLPGSFEISARRTYGHVSAGMICSAKELGLGEHHDGIIVLTEQLGAVAEGLHPGQDLIPVLGLDREVVEVNVTPDRGYCLSMRGIAREYSHSTGATYRDPAGLTVDRATGPGFPVRLADAPLEGVPGCDRFIARAVRGLDTSRRTPAWMVTRLTEAGMRPISLPVDVTNYVMLALGQPLHAYDLARLAGPIVVRRAQPGERLTTLDDVDRALDPQDLLITDGGVEGSAGILALAGVMGGASSEVRETTTEVLIEAAHFEPRTVARTARRHKLSTEGSKRWERGVDPEVTAAAAQLAVDLLVDVGGGTADPAFTEVVAQQRPTVPTIDLDVGLPTRYVGVDYLADRVLQILTAIGCAVTSSGGTLAVLPPSWRPDLLDAPDLVEEVARIDGYDKIPSLLPAAPGGRGLTHAQRARRTVASVLAGQGLVEVLTLPFVGESRFVELGLEAGDDRRCAVRLANPLSEEAPLMRTELLQSMPGALRRNVSRGSKDVALYELGTVTRPTHGAAAPVPGVGARPDDATLQAIRDAVPDQPWHVAVLAAGQAERSGWWGAGRAVEAADAVAWARSVAEALGVAVVAEPVTRMPWHPGRCVRIVLAGDATVAEAAGARGAEVGHAGELHPKVAQELGLPERTVAVELDLDVLVAASEGTTASRPISTQPVATSDVALVVPRSVRYADVERALREGAGDLLESIGLFDVYRGDQVGAGEQSLAFRLTFRAADRTLTTAEVNAARDAAVTRAAEDHGAVQR